MNPLVSVIVPNYNYARTLGLCLEALERQTYRDIEVIVVDDRSTDDSVEIARRHGARVVVTDTNIGAPAARNVGVEHARGEVLFFLDSDLALADDVVEHAVRLLTADPGLGVVCGTYDPEPLIPDSRVERYRSLQLHYWISGDEGDITTIYSALFAMRADVFREIGPLNPALRHSENAEYGHRVTTRGYRIVLDNRIRGRHDHDDRLKVVLSKFFHRARLHIPLYLRRPDFNGGPANSSRGWGSLAALFAVLATPLPALLGPAWAVVPLALLAASIASDLGMYRFVRRYAGLRFTLYFTAVHFLVNVTVAVAVFAGAAQCLVSSRFRRTYDLPVEV
ncbi:glycosyl transferase family 2 [[Actinomadura] parvosata subsp. kistnae]|uniref:Glycosyl transferase n=1 Tax=[Actinomadura] parvosata subsp. kistnae TaxID=1909395 RepID=A0A1U9ZUV3_9ACTN|nr:glycosyltransferase family 2 protein [Nonomuraea sp. ATCC 55076]AQZ61736.1 glycosyl transferase [Nonomuraea sp. ATCC 55076]SPL87852.1 glycosyl transferase family 2 [Actinomadura parvosata subsp. kistnae]